MSNKRGEISILLGFILILFLIFVFFISPVSSSLNEKDKISVEVYEKLEKSDEVRVVVKIEESAADTGLLIKTKKTDNEINLEKQEIKEEIINGIGEENVIHVFDEKIAVEISKDELDELNKNPNVESVIIDKPIFAYLQQSIPYINASLVWPIQQSGINITGVDETVCVLDTGINFTHPDLIGKNKTCIIDCVGKTCVENCSIGDDNGHGTHVAGITAASGGISGVGPNISLIGVKVLNSAGSGSGTDLEKAINWCIANSAAYNISVISMSLGDCTNHNSYCNDDDTADEINNATAYNISVIVAAGNGPGGNCGDTITNTAGPAAPACVQNVTAVGSVNDADGSVGYQRGALFELFAPGISINSTNGKCLSGCTCSGNYMVCSGTSMAAPHVAGAFALFRQFFRLQNGRVPTPSEIKIILNNTGVIIDDSAGSGYNFSRINIYSAIDYLRKPQLTIVSPSNNSYINLANQNKSFICNTTSNYNLLNITFYLWNSTNSLINNSNRTISGISNSTTFNYNFTIEDSYHWNCIAYNNNSFASSNPNNTIIYDITNPIVSSVSSSPSTTSATITWTTNENSNSSVNYGTTTGLGSFSTSSTMTTSNSISLSSLSSSTTYYYNITSCDSANNCAVNGTNSFTTSAADTGGNNPGGGGGGGTTTISAKIYEPTIAEISSITGYTKTLAKDDKIKFTFFDEKNENHTLTITSITSNSVSLTIQSNIINLVLGIGQSAKLNLTNSDYYNFYIKLNSVINNKADITIQTINEQIPKQGITGNTAKETGEQNKGNEEIPQPKQTNIGEYIKDVLIVILIIAVLVILFSRTDIIRQERIKKYREKFRELHPER